VLLDEPTNGLDIPSKAQFRRALALASAEERVLVVSTHQARDLENLLDPIVVIHGGKVLSTFSNADLAARFSVERLKSLEGRPVVHAEQDALGWTALLAAPGSGAALETAFTAAIAEPARFSAARKGRPLQERAATDPEAIR